MPDTAAELEQRAKLLPDERARLVDALLESLNEPAAAQPDAAWEGEIARRLAAHDRGQVQAASAAEVFARDRAITA